jgi:hypothetical protein
MNDIPRSKVLQKGYAQRAVLGVAYTWRGILIGATIFDIFNSKIPCEANLAYYAVGRRLESFTPSKVMEKWSIDLDVSMYSLEQYPEGKLLRMSL